MREPYDFEASIGYWIAVTSQRYQHCLNDELAPYGITFRQFQVLGWLACLGELSPSDLAERMIVEPPTLVGILDRMQREGLVERRCCEGDRRRKLIALCAEAEPVWERVVACLRRVRERATAGMSEADVAILQRLLGQICDNLQANSPVSPRDRAVESAIGSGGDA